MYAVLFASLLFLSVSSFAQNTDAPPQNSGTAPSSENYNDANAFEPNSNAGDSGAPTSDQTDDDSQRRAPASSQNMPVDQD